MRSAADPTRPHLTGDVLACDLAGFELPIAYPPCTTRRQRALMGPRQAEQDRAHSAKRCWRQPVPRIALENPSAPCRDGCGRIDRVVQPWMFGTPDGSHLPLAEHLPRLRPSVLILDMLEERVRPAAPAGSAALAPCQGSRGQWLQQWGGEMPPGGRPMPLIQLIVVLLVIGVLLYVVETLLPIDATIKNVIRIIILLAVVLWLLTLVGLLPGGTVRIGPG